MELNKKNMKKLVILITFGIGLFWLLDSIPAIWDFISHVLNLLFPFILGGVIAFILNIPMKKIENFIKSRIKNKKSNLSIRTISITLSLVMFIGIILLICFLLIPELIENIQLLLKNIPAFINEAEVWILDLVENYPDIQKQVEDTLKNTNNFNDIIATLLNYIINGSLNFISNLISGLFTLFTAIVFAIYMLSQKEYLIRGCKKLIYATINKNKAERIVKIGDMTNTTFL